MDPSRKTCCVAQDLGVDDETGSQGNSGVADICTVPLVSQTMFRRSLPEYTYMIMRRRLHTLHDVKRVRNKCAWGRHRTGPHGARLLRSLFGNKKSAVRYFPIVTEITFQELDLQRWFGDADTSAGHASRLQA